MALLVLTLLLLHAVLSSQQLQDACSLPKETGLCRAAFPRFFYNATAGECQVFIYGGCGGNANNFGSLQECQDAC